MSAIIMSAMLAKSKNATNRMPFISNKIPNVMIIFIGNHPELSKRLTKKTNAAITSNAPKSFAIIYLSIQQTI